jgi:uncharacterized protein DUF1778
VLTDSVLPRAFSLEIIGNLFRSSQCIILLSGSIKAVAKKDHIPSRRTGKGPLGAKVFSYYTQDERRLIEKAAKREHRSLSSFVALAAVERAQRVLGRN